MTGTHRILADNEILDTVKPLFDDGEILYVKFVEDGIDVLIIWNDVIRHVDKTVRYQISCSGVLWEMA